MGNVGRKQIFKNFTVKTIYRKTKPETNLQRPSCCRYNIQLLSISMQNGDIDNGKFVSNHNGIKLDDIGNRKIRMNFGGITKIMMKHFILVQNEVNPLAMFTVFDRISDRIEFGDINIRYDDRGFVNKVLDYDAENSGMTRETLRTQIKSTLPLMGTKI